MNTASLGFSRAEFANAQPFLGHCQPSSVVDKEHLSPHSQVHGVTTARMILAGLCGAFAPQAQGEQLPGHALLVADPQKQEQNKLQEHIECLCSVSLSPIFNWSKQVTGPNPHGRGCEALLTHKMKRRV